MRNTEQNRTRLPTNGSVAVNRRKKWKWFLFLLYTLHLEFIPIPSGLYTFLTAADMEVKLNSADGSTSFQVRDSADVVVSSITSLGDASFSTTTINGNITVKGSVYPGADQSTHSISYDTDNSRLDISTAVVKGNLQVENNFYPGQGLGVSQGTRYIADSGSVLVSSGPAALQIHGGSGDALAIKDGGDLKIYKDDNTGSAMMYCETADFLTIGSSTTITGNVTVNGDLKVSGKIYYVYKTSITYYNASPGWLQNTAAADWDTGWTITGEDFSPTGAVLVRGGIAGMSDEDSTVGVATCTTINIHETVSNTYGDVWAQTTLQHDNPVVAYTPWYAFTLTGSRTYVVSAFTRSSAKWYGFQKVWIEVIPQP